MFANQFAAAIEAAHPSQLDRWARNLWRAHGAEQITATEAERLAEAIEARRGDRRRLAEPASWQSSIFPKRREQPARRHPERMARRRRLAFSGPLPPTLAACWTTARLAILRIVGDEVREHGACELSLAEIAARAGSCRTMARTTLRQAFELGLVLIEERPQPDRKNLPNRVRIVSREWLNWLKRGQQTTLAVMLAAFDLTGGKKTPPTDTNFIFTGARTTKNPARPKPPRGFGEKAESKRLARADE